MVFLQNKLLSQNTPMSAPSGEELEPELERWMHPRKDDARVGLGLAYSAVAASRADGLWLR